MSCDILIIWKCYLRVQLSKYLTLKIFDFQNLIQLEFIIQKDLTASSNINIDVLGISGGVIETIINERQMAGEYSLKVNKSDKLSPGIYFVCLMIYGQLVVKGVTLQ